MRFFYNILILIWLLNLTRAQDDFNEEWTRWKKQYNKVYSTARQNAADITHEQYKFKIFQDRLRKIHDHNLKNQSFKMGTNEFSDLSDTELNFKFRSNLDLKTIVSNVQKAKKESTNAKRNLEESIDWLQNGVVTAARNQGSCGSCYSFSAVAAIESALSIRKNLKNPNLPTFSEQQIIDCSYRLYYNKTTKSYSNLGCNGGYLYNTLYYAMTKGLLNNNYASKYVGEVQKCQYKSSDSVTKITGIFSASMKVGDYEAMKRAVAQQPIMTHMYVASDFYNYQTGIYSSSLCTSSLTSCPKGVSHAVTIVGYGSENDEEYWLVKNSWGTTFGEKNGFFRIALGKNMCCIEGYTYYPKI